MRGPHKVLASLGELIIEVQFHFKESSCLTTKTKIVITWAHNPISIILSIIKIRQRYQQYAPFVNTILRIDVGLL